MTTALTKIDKQYPVLYDPSGLSAVRENLGDETFDTFDLDRVKVPSGGSLVWELVDEEPSKTLEGIWIYHRLVRGYWAQSLGDGGGGNPPDCMSRDSLVGVANEVAVKLGAGGDCTTCGFAQFGSAEKGSGQACKKMRQVFFLREGNLLPTLLVVPPSSLKAAKQYLYRLANRAVPYWSVVTRLKLERTKNNDGIEFGRIVFERAGDLAPDVIERIRQYRAQIEPQLHQVSVDPGATEEAPF
jgi:hypothetical protein